MQKFLGRIGALLPIRQSNVALSQSEERNAIAAPCLLLLLLSCAASSSQAADAPPYAVLLRQSLENAPALLEQAAAVRAASAEARQARAWPNPSVSAVYENLGASPSGGISQRQDTYTVTQAVELGSKRTARIEAEEQKASAVAIRGRQAQIAYAGELAIAYATAEAMQRRKELAAEELARANDDLRVAQALVKAGREAELRVVQARASAAAALAAQQSAAADASEALERLSALAGARETYTGIGQPLLPQAAAYRPAANRLSEEAPAVASATAERDALAAQVRAEEKKWIPDLSVSAGVRKFGGTGDTAKTVGVSVSIPLFDRNQSGIDAAKARASGASARLEMVRLEAAAQRRSAEARVLASDKQLEAAVQGESAASEAYRLGRAGYDAGKTSLVELLAIRRALSEAKILTIAAQLARVRALAVLSMAEGRIAFGETP